MRELRMKWRIVVHVGQSEHTGEWEDVPADYLASTPDGRAKIASDRAHEILRDINSTVVIGAGVGKTRYIPVRAVQWIDIDVHESSTW